MALIQMQSAEHAICSIGYSTITEYFLLFLKPERKRCTPSIMGYQLFMLFMMSSNIL